jgi:hypothetical protein
MTAALDMTLMQHQEPKLVSATVRIKRTSWGGVVQENERWNGVPYKPGYGARLAVRKYGDALNKLAD